MDQISKTMRIKLIQVIFRLVVMLKFHIGNGMNLDLTFNPDFSQVEVDDLVKIN